ncbi:winged helix-turn-helix transcriptional regulator [uncultured Treponema sp.]|uniref:winged helix-turn-helix transcriptional regulator n=1 Tax=uncultured Treponema sp. TaxID=162155 RepID=UPI0025F66B9F|nr:winged helix-turn-helix transcriptional regulator [uncultured Treponema sp.]
MNTDVATLQNIADTLKEEPLASQRVLAEKAGMSIGLMNAVINRFVERGWIMLTNVNLRKLSYAITPAGIAELTARSQNFAKRTFAIANKYNETLCKVVSDAKNDGKDKIVLYGNSYIKFLLNYACQTIDVTFIEKSTSDPIEPNAFCVVGEQCAEEELARLTAQGGVSLLNLLEE